MKTSLFRSLQAGVAAVAVCAAGFAMAQPAPADAPPPPPKHHKHKPVHPKGDRKHERRDVAAGSSSEREAAAALQADRKGELTGADRDQYRANAVARCSVFKMEEDKRACIDRVAKGNDSGSVQGGGILREYTYTVPAKQP